MQMIRTGFILQDFDASFLYHASKYAGGALYLDGRGSGLLPLPPITIITSSPSPSDHYDISVTEDNRGHRRELGIESIQGTDQKVLRNERSFNQATMRQRG